MISVTKQTGKIVKVSFINGPVISFLLICLNVKRGERNLKQLPTTTTNTFLFLFSICNVPQLHLVSNVSLRHFSFHICWKL